jgi:hypothetical protein
MLNPVRVLGLIDKSQKVWYTSLMETVKVASEREVDVLVAERFFGRVVWKS